MHLHLFQHQKMKLMHRGSYFNCHVDKYNGRVQPFNYIIIAISKAIVVNHKKVRLSCNGYGRKPIEDYYNPLKMYTPIINDVALYTAYNNLNDRVAKNN